MEDTEIIFNAIRGRDPLDSTSIEITNHKSQITNSRFIVGVPRDFLTGEGIDKAVLQNFDESVKKLEEAGVEIREVKLPNVKYSLACYYIIMPAEVSSNLARFDGVKYGLREDGANLLDDYRKTRGLGFGREARRRIILGTYVLSAGYYDSYYGRAVSLRRLIQRDFDEVWSSGVHAVLTPTAPSPAFKIGEKTSDPLAMYLADIFTVTANIAGIPAISVPSGQSPEGLPFGIQFMTQEGREDILFGIGRHFETIRA